MKFTSFKVNTAFAHILIASKNPVTFKEVSLQPLETLHSFFQSSLHPLNVSQQKQQSQQQYLTTHWDERLCPSQCLSCVLVIPLSPSHKHLTFVAMAAHLSSPPGIIHVPSLQTQLNAAHHSSSFHFQGHFLTSDKITKYTNLLEAFFLSSYACY